MLKAAVEGDMTAMREMHVLSPGRLKAAHNKVQARYLLDVESNTIMGIQKWLAIAL